MVLMEFIYGHQFPWFLQSLYTNILRTSSPHREFAIKDVTSFISTVFVVQDYFQQILFGWKYTYTGPLNPYLSFSLCAQF